MRADVHRHGAVYFSANVEGCDWRIERMKLIWLALVIAAAVAVASWRGITTYRYTFHKKDL